MNFPPPWVSPTPPHSPTIYTLDSPNCVISYWTAWIFIFLITVKFRSFECHWPLFSPSVSAHPLGWSFVQLSVFSLLPCAVFGALSITPYQPQAPQHLLQVSQPLVSQGRHSVHLNDAEADAPILWPPNLESQLFRKDPDAGQV